MAIPVGVVVASAVAVAVAVVPAVVVANMAVVVANVVVVPEAVVVASVVVVPEVADAVAVKVVELVVSVAHSAHGHTAPVVTAAGGTPDANSRATSTCIDPSSSQAIVQL